MFKRYVCGNGTHGTFNPPLEETAELAPDGLLLNGYYTAVRTGDH